MAKRVTLTQVAELAGVSVMTASYAYNSPDRVSDQARGKVLAAAAELGYAGPDPRARSLRQGRTLTLGVVMGELLSYAFDDPGAVAFLAGIADVCAPAGYGMTILPVTGADDDVERITRAAVDGFVLWTTSDDDPVLAAVQAMRRPAVVHGGPSVDGLGRVSIDNRAAAYAVGSVAFAGARRPAIVSMPLTRARTGAVVRADDLPDVLFPVTRDRLAGYREAAGISWAEVVVGVCPRNSVADAERVAEVLLGSADPPDAIVAMSDQQAVGVVRAVRAAGLAIPDDVAVTGWDDLPMAAELGLTTVAQSLRDQGASCARVVLGRSEAPAAPSWFVVRRSSTRG